MVGCYNDDALDQSVKVNRKARFGKHAKPTVHTPLHHSMKPDDTQHFFATELSLQSLRALRQIIMIDYGNL